MSNQEILEKVIEKAIENGWKTLDDREWYIHESDIAPDRWLLCLPNHKEKTKKHLSILEVIYSHDFAKALWGTNIHQTSYEDFPENWQYHLQQMVLVDDPIAYLGENI